MWEAQRYEQLRPMEASPAGPPAARPGRTPPVGPPVLRLLHRCANYLVIDKPPDVRIDGDHAHTTQKMLQDAFPDLASELRHCHQLDYATSGVMCYALSRQAAAAASWLFEHRHTEKAYLALVEGHMADERAESVLPIADDPNHDFKMMIGTPEVPGRAAETVVIRLAVGQYHGRDISKVQLQPRTGRRHQLRLHCAALGHPIVGDATYGDDTESQRMMLHAWKLVLPFSQVPPKRRGVRPAKRHRPGGHGGGGGGGGGGDRGGGSMAAQHGKATAQVTEQPAAIPAEDLVIESDDPFSEMLAEPTKGRLPKTE